MRMMLFTALVLSGNSFAANTPEQGNLISNSHLSCKLARDMRRRDAAKSSSAFEYYLSNKANLQALDDAYAVDGLTAAKVKKFCARIEKDLMRGKALGVYDKASKACSDSRSALAKGLLKDAKQQYANYEAYLAEAKEISAAALDLERGSLQWRRCEQQKQDLLSFTSGKVKKVRDDLDKAYARCLPIWSEMSTKAQSSVPAKQLSKILQGMKRSLASLRPRVKKLNTQSLDSGVREFQSCINQVEAGLPTQYALQRLSALQSSVAQCESGNLPDGFNDRAKALLKNAVGAGVKLDATQLNAIAVQEQALSECLPAVPEPVSDVLSDPVGDDPLLLDLELEEGGDSSLNIIDQLLQEDG